MDMRFRLALVASLVCLGSLAQQTLSVDKLVEFLESSIKMKMPDKQVAAYVSRIKLNQKLEDHVIETLQGDGLGPKTGNALRRIGSAPASLQEAVLKKPEAPPPPPPPPPYDEQNSILNEVREYALN